MLKHRACNFLLPVGGTMNMSQFWHIDVVLTIFTIKHHRGLKAFLTTFEVDLVNPLGGVHQSL